MLAISTMWNVARLGGFAAALAEVRALGFEGVELAGEGPDVAAIPAVLGERRLDVVCADGGFGRRFAAETDRLEPGFASTVEADRARIATALLGVAARAKKCGTNRVAIRCGVVPVPGADARWDDWTRRTAVGGVPDEIRDEAAALLAEREAIRDVHLDAACRMLHGLSRADPETEWWILPASRPHALPLPDEMEHLLAEIPGGRPAWVHDPAAATTLESLGSASVASWLEAADSRLAAVRLSDAFGLETGLPPGAGSVDWDRVRDGLISGLPRVLWVTRPCRPDEIVEAARFLESR